MGIQIAAVLAAKRRDKGVTQDELARYIGVSKASVSKWETGQSFPDITFLPELAAYFNISVDALIGYEPQMTKEDIRALYLRLCEEFTHKPFAVVFEECRAIAKKFYACFALLFQIGALFINYSDHSDDPPSVLAEAKELLVRVKTQCEDVHLKKQALALEAVCELSLGRPEAVLSLLGEAAPLLDTDTLLATAYQMTGNASKAREILQIGMYRYVSALMGIFPSYLTLLTNDERRFEEAVERALGLSEVFALKDLHPSLLLPVYLVCAQGYLLQDRREEALAMLQRYAVLAVDETGALKLHGDGFFDLLDGYLEEFPLGSAPPRSEAAIRRGILSAVAQNPAFAPLQGEAEYQIIVRKLESICERS